MTVPAVWPRSLLLLCISIYIPSLRAYQVIAPTNFNNGRSEDYHPGGPVLPSYMLHGKAHDVTPLEASAMTAKISIEGKVNFVSESNQADTLRTSQNCDRQYHFKISSALASLYWYPRDSYLQRIANVDIQNSSSRNFYMAKQDNMLEFEWEIPNTNSVSFQLVALVQTRREFIPISQKISFPLLEKQVSSAMLNPYLSYAKIADTNNEIANLAWALVDRRDDLYHAIFSLADWVNTNIEYSLASKMDGKDNIQSASQVLRTRYGKCDELTTLFVSLSRALGVPARFVNGYAYNNNLELFGNDRWVAHTWAEVWFPSPVEKWIPFDVTYGEYGYLTTGHIMLHQSEDGAQQTSIAYKAVGEGYFALNVEELKIDVSLGDLCREDNNPIIDISLDAPRTQVGFGSVVGLIAVIRNLRNHYVSTSLDLITTSDTEILLGRERFNILLNPREERRIPILAKVGEASLKNGFEYYYPFEISSHSELGKKGGITITMNEKAPVFSEKDFFLVEEMPYLR